MNHELEQPKPATPPAPQTPAELEAQALEDRIKELIASGLYA